MKKVQLFFLAAGLALVGMALDSSVLVGLAILALLAGIVLRVLPGKEGTGDGRAPEEGESHAEEDAEGS